MRISIAPVLAFGLAASATAALAAPPRTFLEKAIQGDNSEIDLGTVAQQKGGSPQIREFGQTLVADHTQAKQQAVEVAKSEGMTPPTSMAPEAKAESKKLQGLSGAAFDKEFARYMVMDHKKDIADFEKQAASGDAKTATLAKQALPTLRKHLEMAQKLSAS